VSIERKSKLEFGAHTIGSRDQYRVLVLRGQPTQGPKPANPSKYLGPHGPLGQWLDAVDKGISSIDIDTCFAIGQGG